MSVVLEVRVGSVDCIGNRLLYGFERSRHYGRELSISYGV
jgi:hypothetical protein